MATIEAEVIRILDHALVVLLPDGRKGRIRKREISWNELVDPLSAVFHVGQRIKAARSLTSLFQKKPAATATSNLFPRLGSIRRSAPWHRRWNCGRWWRNRWHWWRNRWYRRWTHWHWWRNRWYWWRRRWQRIKSARREFHGLTRAERRVVGVYERLVGAILKADPQLVAYLLRGT